MVGATSRLRVLDVSLMSDIKVLLITMSRKESCMCLIDGSDDGPGPSTGQQLALDLHSISTIVPCILMFLFNWRGHSPLFRHITELDDSHVGHMLAIAPSSK